LRTPLATEQDPAWVEGLEVSLKKKKKKDKIYRKLIQKLSICSTGAPKGEKKYSTLRSQKLF
jgi:hypothetical protein